ncbi:unnamed protein product [Pieris macdunnoughi]|uniref:ZU5 domain-containing protein n=1 Tax=Pieris macdunnoughi TaxID=345717 RepID=A0A821WFH2_9NEOP|nr:unnamed protein product [Pieris macdunnoughi]
MEGKYRVAAPELMQDTFMSDSEDEGGEVECPIQQQQQYRYMNSEAGTLNRAKPLEDSVTDGHLWPSNNDSRVATIERQPLDIGFLVSFVVDARGGAMKAKRRGGVRIIVPPAACAAPTRVTCRAATRRAPAAAPPPLMEGEALASRLLELQPQGAKFLAPVILEVPIFTASCPEREIVILRSDTGETWQDHYLHNNDNAMVQEALTRERQEHGNSGETLGENGERVTRIITCDFPHYLAVVSRVRQEVHIIGPEGGTVSSAHIPQVQALFPHKRSQSVYASASKRTERTVPGEKPSTANLRLLCSIMGGQARAVWEDVTGSTPLTITDDCASFTTTVSARFWLMNCQNVSDATKMATELYRQMLVVPFEVRIVVLGKRLDALEGRLLVLYITDRYAYETLLQQEHYTEIAHSTSVRFLDGKEVFLEFSGNLIPVTKSGSQPLFTFEAFKDNRVEFTVRVKHHEESPSGRIYFMNEPKVAKGEQSQTPACVLDVELPERIAPRAAKSQMDYLNLDQSGFDALKDELSFHWNDHNHSIGPPSLPTHHETSPKLNGHDKTIANGNVKLPSKDTDDVKPKPQVNGDSVHVDSNKVKATFDSDEDKTPMNTLEKGKKKQDGGFFGGLAGKVKNVFGGSEEKEDSKESSPKPQPKPRESKDKSPPKPAPRIINEDLLEKVDDMFKDLKVKPHVKIDDDANNRVYLTKLIVDEDQPSLKEKTEDMYHQYEHMQPVETPLHCQKSDPFQFYTGCCEGTYKHGEKHRHDETPNLADRIEQVNFTVHETIQEIADRADNESKDVLDKLDTEKDNLRNDASQISENAKKNIQNYKNDLVIVEETLKNNVQNGVNQLGNSLSGKVDYISEESLKTKSDFDNLNTEVRTKAKAEVENIQTAAQDIVNNILNQASPAKSDHKTFVMDFLAAEQLEASKHLEDINQKKHDNEISLKDKAQESVNKIKETAHDVKNDISQKTEDLKNNIKDKAESAKDATKENITDLKENMDKKTNSFKKGTKNKIEDIKNATNEKLSDLGDTIDSAKDKTEKGAEIVKSKAKEAKENAKAEGKKKSKEGKNFFTGLVHNIFGEKDKVEEDVKAKVSEAKKSATKLSKQASQMKEDAEETVAKKQEQCTDFLNNETQIINSRQVEIINNGNDLIEKIENKTEELKDIVQDTKSAVAVTVQEVVNDATNSKDKMVQDAKNQMTPLLDNVEEKKNEVSQELENVKNNAIHCVQETANNAIKEIESKKEQVTKNAHNQAEELIKNVQGQAEEKAVKIKETQEKVVHFVEDKTSDMLDVIQLKKEDLTLSENNLIENIQSTKNNLLQNTEEATDHAMKDLHNTTSQIVQNINEEREKAINNAQSKSDEIVKSVKIKEDEFTTAIQDKTHAATEALTNTKAVVEQVVQKKKGDLRDTEAFVQNAATEHMDRIRKEAENTTEDIKRTAEETLNAVTNKKSEIEANFINEVTEIKDSGKSHIDEVKQTAHSKADEVKESAEQAFDYVKDSSLGAFDMIEAAAKDKVTDATDTWEDLQSSTRDTYADIKDDFHGLESSAQDTLHSLQSSAGNTFDSLDDSTREVIGDVQISARKAEETSKELFGSAKDSFEGFTVTAGNKLEDATGAANDRIDEAGQRLDKAENIVVEEVKATGANVAESVTSEADKFASNLNDLGNSVFGMSGKGFMKDSSKKLLASEKSQSSPHKKTSGFFSKLRRNH